MEFSNLVETPQEQIYNIFLRAFCDYKVNVQISFEQFLTLQKRSLYSSEFSFGCFDEKVLVAFVMNGLRIEDSGPVCYGCAVGVIPEYRRKDNLTFNFFDFYLSRLGKLGVKKYLCETMRENTPAVKIVKKCGFAINKNLISYRKKIDELDICVTDRDGFDFHIENKLFFSPLYKTFEYESSWQNSLYSINAILQDFSILSVKKDGSVIGYGVINKTQGDIPQFIIHEDYRGMGLGSTLLSKLIGYTSSKYISLFNVDEENFSLNKFLEKKEFEIYTKGYEMVKYF